MLIVIIEWIIEKNDLFFSFTTTKMADGDKVSLEVFGKWSSEI